MHLALSAKTIEARATASRPWASAHGRHRGGHAITDSGEPGTSKTRSGCGHLDAALGASRVSSCARCGVCTDRDVNGWRGNPFAACGLAEGIG